MVNVLFGIFCFLIIACLIYFCVRFLLMLFGISRAIKEGNKNANLTRISRQAELKIMSVDNLRGLLRNNIYLTKLNGCASLEEFFRNLQLNNESEIIKNINERNLYCLLVDAEYARGHKGRPEAGDNVSEIWDIIYEISTRQK